MLARGVIFVDLALAQVAALGISVAFLAGHPIQSDAAYWYALVFTGGRGRALRGRRVHKAPIPQEALIGIVYAVSAAAAVLVVDRAPQGGEHIKTLLVGSILTVTGREVAGDRLALRRDRRAAPGHAPAVARDLARAGRRAGPRPARLRWWDFFFYITFGIVVTSSVRIAGVLLVFSYLIVPAAVAAVLTASVRARLLIGWSVGALVSAAGLWASFAWDLPTGAAVVTSFGALTALVAIALGVRVLSRRVRERGMGSPAWGRRAAFALSLALAGLLLTLLPGMDHLWLDWLEEVAPAARLAFLTPGRAHCPAGQPRGPRPRHRRAVPTARAPAGRRSGARGQMPGEQQERLRQFLASPRGDRRRRPGGARHAAGTVRARASASGSGPRSSCWARRARRGSASGRGCGAASRTRTARR